MMEHNRRLDIINQYNLWNENIYKKTEEDNSQSILSITQNLFQSFS